MKQDYKETWDKVMKGLHNLVEGGGDHKNILDIEEALAILNEASAMFDLGNEIYDSPEQATFCSKVIYELTVELIEMTGKEDRNNFIRILSLFNRIMKANDIIKDIKEERGEEDVAGLRFTFKTQNGAELRGRQNFGFGVVEIDNGDTVSQTPIQSDRGDLFFEIGDERVYFRDVTFDGDII